VAVLLEQGITQRVLTFSKKARIHHHWARGLNDSG
jgi:hypothetical protein